jgi:hypothetical protein
MKRFTFAAYCLTVAIAVSGCGGIMPGVSPGLSFDPNDKQDVCVKKPPEATSWLCEAAVASNISLNKLDRLLLDGSAAGVILADIDLVRVDMFLTKVENYLSLASVEGLTYKLLIERMKMDAAKATVLKNMISRYIDVFVSGSLISEYDLYLIRLEIKNQRAQFGLVKGIARGW